LRDLARKPPADRKETLARTKQSLNASLIKHTIEYFFSQVCKDLAACDQAQPDEMQSEVVQDKSGRTRPFGLGSWRNIFLSEKPVDKSLLGHAFDEIQQREKALLEITRQFQSFIVDHQ
jgi:ribosomal protein L16 Arg81 hydroxylase